MLWKLVFGQLVGNVSEVSSLGLYSSIWTRSFSNGKANPQRIDLSHSSFDGLVRIGGQMEGG